MTNRRNWTREQLLAAFSLYCHTPFGQMHAKNPQIIKYAELIGRTPSALAMKLCNIASLDPVITSTGRKGLQGASSSDRAMWEEMNGDWEAFISKTQKAITSLKSLSSDRDIPEGIEENDYTGKNKLVQTNARIGQHFFRKSVLSSYNNRCCITGLTITKLLVASHIVPWSKDPANRLNPQNGLSLSMLHDKAFDIGLITINENLTVRVSRHIEAVDDNFFSESIQCYEGKNIYLPEKFQPCPKFLTYHRENVFEHWL